MNEYILFTTIKLNIERMWREAERRAQLEAVAGQYGPEEESLLSRRSGGRT